MNPTKTSCPTCGNAIPDDAPMGLCPQCLLLAGLEQGKSEVYHDPKTARGRPFTAPEISQISAIIPNLEVIELLGQGGMGAVYKARQKGLNRTVAVKILPPEIESAPAFTERFEREAQALARLSHPNIVSVYDYGETDGICFIVMEYVDGVNLRQLIANGEISPEQALAIVPQICDALNFAHSEGVVHRDVKPENILVDHNGNVKIADFGLAKLLDHNNPKQFLTGTHQVMGTPQYMAPEQLQGTRAVDHRADIYSLGVVFYELLTGELPIGKFDPPSEKVRVDVRLDEVVLRALESEPARRYQRATDVQHDLKTLSDLPIPAKPKILSSGPGVANQLRAPAKALVGVGIFNWILAPICIAIASYQLNMMSADSQADIKWITFSVASAAFLLVSTIASSVMILGGLKLLRMNSYKWPKFGAIAAIILMPGNLIGLPIGMWVLASLATDQVRNELGVSVNKSKLEKPVFSRKAIAGICWAAFFVPFIFMMFMTTTENTSNNGLGQSTTIMTDNESSNGSTQVSSTTFKPESLKRPQWQWAIITAIGILGLTAPIATTVLGYISVGDIQRSNGQVWGLPLAITDALLFPLLIIDILIGVLVARLVYTAIHFAEQGGWEGITDSVAVSFILVITIPLCVYVDFLIARSFWKRSSI